MKIKVFYNRFIVTFLGIFLSAAIIYLDNTLIFAKNTKKVHKALIENDLKYKNLDTLKIQNILNKLKPYEVKSLDENYGKSTTNQLSVEKDKKELSNLLVQLIKECDIYYTNINILKIEADKDVTDKKVTSKLQSLLEDQNFIDEKVKSVIRTLSKGAFYSVILNKFPKTYVDILRADNTDFPKILSEYNALKKKEQELLQSIVKLKNSSKKNNSILALKYMEVLKVRNRIAKLFGYKNYAEYADKEIYNRDVDEKLREEYYNAVKKYVVPLYKEIASFDKKSGYTKEINNQKAPKSNKIIKEVSSEIENIDKSLKESFEYLKKYHTFDIDYSSKKSDISYAENLYAYNSAYIFNYPEGNMNDIKNFIRRFGEYNAIFHSNLNSLSDINTVGIRKIQSNALELIVAENADKIVGKLAGAYKYTSYEATLFDLIKGCYFDELQRYLFSNENLGVNEINSYAKKLAKEYGIKKEYSKNNSYEWLENRNIIFSPMSDLSDSLSAITSLKIGCMAENNYKGAVNKYLEVSRENGIKPYLKVCEEIGFSDILTKDSVKQITKNVNELLLCKKVKNCLAVDKIITIITSALLIIGFIIFLYNILKSKKI